MNFRIETATESVKFAIRKLEDMQSSEDATQSEATKLSGVSSELKSLQKKLEQIHRVLFTSQANWEHSEDADPTVQKYIIDCEDVGKHTETAIFTFMNRVDDRIIPGIFMGLKPKPINFFALHMLKADIQLIKSRVGTIEIEHLGAPSDIAITQSARRSLHNVDDIWFLGLENYRKSILRRLVNQSLQTRCVVPVSGTKVFAKSVLAEKIYQSTEVKTYFEACFWLFPPIKLHPTYSKPYLFEPIDIMRKMLLKLGDTNSLDASDNEIESQLNQYLCQKRCLVVVDNNWKELWDAVIKAFPDGNNGSQLLMITSEEEEGSDYEEEEYSDYEEEEEEEEEGGEEEGEEEEEDDDDEGGGGGGGGGGEDITGGQGGEGEDITGGQGGGGGEDSDCEYELQSLNYQEDTQKYYKYEPPSLHYQDGLKLGNLGRKDLLESEECPSDFFGADSPTKTVLSGNQLLCYILDDRHPMAWTYRYEWYSGLPSVLKTCIVYTATVFPCGSILLADSLIQLWIVEGIIPHEEGRTMEEIAEIYIHQLVERGLLRIIRSYYHNQDNNQFRSIVLQPTVHYIIYSEAHHDQACNEEGFSLVIPNLHPRRTNINNPNLHHLALHQTYQFNHIYSFEKGPELHCLNYPSLHSLFFFGYVAPVASSPFNFLRVLAVFSSHIQFPKEYTPCWLDELINLRYLGFIVCLVEGGSLGKTLDRLGKLEILDLSASIVSGLSEFIKNNKKVNIVGPVKDELPENWSPIPDMSQ